MTGNGNYVNLLKFIWKIREITSVELIFGGFKQFYALPGHMTIILCWQAIFYGNCGMKRQKTNIFGQPSSIWIRLWIKVLPHTSSDSFWSNFWTRVVLSKSLIEYILDLNWSMFNWTLWDMCYRGTFKRVGIFIRQLASSAQRSNFSIPTTKM